MNEPIMKNVSISFLLIVQLVGALLQGSFKLSPYDLIYTPTFLVDPFRPFMLYLFLLVSETVIT